MIYVPIVVPTQVPPPSPRTRELAELLDKVLEEYTKAHPATTRAEVRAAIRMAQMSTGPDRTKVATGVSLAIGVSLAMGVLGFAFFRSAGVVDIRSISVPIIMAVIVFLGLVVGIIAMKSR